jgi:uncharacterized protein
MESIHVSQQDIQPHSFWQSIALHLLPGVLLTIFFVLAVPVVENKGFPAPFALVLAILFVLIPFELGILFYEGKKRNGTFSLRGIVLYQEKIHVWQYFLLVPALLFWLIICFSLFTPVDNFLIKTVFSWLPAWFIPSNWLMNIDQYSKANLVVVMTLYAVANVFMGPVVEELYFRGYLLPRLSHLKGWAPLINTVLFSLYHFFSPWQQLSRILGLLPMVYVVAWKRNIYLGIIIHCLLNLLATVSMIAMVFG